MSDGPSAGVDVRALTAADLPAAWDLGSRAFGGPGDPPPEALDATLPVTRWGAFDARGRLVGKATDQHGGQWWGGRRLPASDVAGVAVPPEQRGSGVAGALLTTLLRGAHDRGAAISTLYPTVSAPYRSLGWEVCGVLRTVEVPTALLARGRRPAGVVLRAATAADWSDIVRVYTEVASLGDGFLTREGMLAARPRDGGRLPEGLDGVTLAVEDDRVTGYASWARGTGYGHHTEPGGATLTVPDLLALTSAAARALVASLGTWESVTPTVRMRPLPWADAVNAVLPVERLRVVGSDAWMSRPVDVVAAVAGRGWAEHAGGSVAFRLHDDAAPWNAGAWRLTVEGGGGRLERAADADAVLDVRGWSLLWSGAGTPAQVRTAGLLHGGTAADDVQLARTLAAGRPAALLDYF